MTTAAKRKRRDAPTPDEVKAARIAAGLNQTEAAEVVYVRQASWSRWEAGIDSMPLSLWVFFQLRQQGIIPPLAMAKPLGSEVRAARRAAGLTQDEAAALALVQATAWGWYERNPSERIMSPAVWQLFLLKASTLDGFGRLPQK